MSQNSNNSSHRSRPHPDERFAPPAQVFALSAAADELSKEPSATTRPHRQKVLYRHGNTSLALFLFDAGAELREHRTNGTVFIQVLEGRLAVQAQGQRHDLSAGQVLVMSPGVPHDLHALEPARMLLTVCLEASSLEPDQQKH
jgi:quercetin dioxygenase-like cupin family protein